MFMKIYISYAREDCNFALKLYSDLKNDGHNPWIDIKDLIPGEKWKNRIYSVINESNYFFVLLSSNSVSKRGFFQVELKKAFDVYNEFPENSIFVVPIRINECKPTDERLFDIHWTDFFPSYSNGYKKILNLLKSNVRNDLIVDNNDILSKDKLTDENNQLISQQIQKRLSKTNHTEEAKLFVLNRLSENKWELLKKSIKNNFLSVTIKRILEEFAKTKCENDLVFPLWVIAKGSIWVSVYQRMCVEKMSIIDVINSFDIGENEKSKKVIIEEAIAVIILKNFSCASMSINKKMIDDPKNISYALDLITPAEIMESLDDASIIRWIYNYLLSNDMVNIDHLYLTQSHRTIEKLKPKLKSSLNGQDRVFLKLRYFSGYSITQAGEMMNLTNRESHAIHRRLKQTIEEIFIEAGCGIYCVEILIHNHLNFHL